MTHLIFFSKSYFVVEIDIYRHIQAVHWYVTAFDWLIWYGRHQLAHVFFCWCSTGHPDQLVCHNMGWTSRWMGTRYRLVTWAGDHICCFVSVVLLELNLMVPCIEHFINGQMLTWCYKTFCLFIEESCDDSCSSKTIILTILPSLPIIIKWYNRRQKCKTLLGHCWILSDQQLVKTEFLSTDKSTQVHGFEVGIFVRQQLQLRKCTANEIIIFKFVFSIIKCIICYGNNTLNKLVIDSKLAANGRSNK